MKAKAKVKAKAKAKAKTRENFANKLSLKNQSTTTTMNPIIILSQ